MSEPVITNITPAGRLPSKNTVVEVSITDNVSVELVTILAKFPSLGLTECVWHNGSFRAPYEQSAQSSFDFDLRRTGGWPADFDLEVTAVDNEGNITGRAPAGAFTPADLNAEFWIRADLGHSYSDGQAMAAITNQGTDPDGDLVQVTGSLQPIYRASESETFGAPAIEFDGTNLLYSTGTNWWTVPDGSDLTIIAVVKTNSAVTTQDYVFYTETVTVGGFSLRAGSSAATGGRLEARDGTSTAVSYSNGFEPGFTFCIAGTLTGALSPGLDQATTYIDGVPGFFSGSVDLLDIAPTSGSRRLIVGGTTTTVPRYWGFMNELIILKRALTSTEASDLANYFAGRYGTANRPVVL